MTMDRGLQIKLSLLRGESPCPMDFASFGRLSAIELRTQMKSGLADRLAVAMLGMIASGRLPPGSRIPPERRIAEAISASRVCVRSALDRLKLDGYIEATQGSGTRVMPVGRSARIDQLIRANQENFEDLQAFIVFLDGCVVECLLRKASDDEILELAERVASRAAALSPQALAEAETELRIALAAASGNPIFHLITNQLARGMRSFFVGIFRATHAGAKEAILQNDRDLADAFARGDISVLRAILARRGDVLRDLPGEAGPDRADNDPMGEAGILRDLSIANPEQLKDRLTREIAGMIATVSARDGARLLSERRLAELFGVSRASVREALAALKAEGVIVADARCGTRITEVKAELASLAAADLDNLKTMSRLRGYLEVWAASRAAVRASPSDFCDLRRILTEMGRPHQSPRRRIDLDIRLHLTIARAAGSAVHLFITEILRELMTAYFDYSLSEPAIGGGRDEMLLRHHRKIVAAILARDSEGAGRAMSEHCGAFSDRYEAIDLDRELPRLRISRR